MYTSIHCAIDRRLLVHMSAYRLFTSKGNDNGNANLPEDTMQGIEGALVLLSGSNYTINSGYMRVPFNI